MSEHFSGYVLEELLGIPFLNQSETTPPLIIHMFYNLQSRLSAAGIFLVSPGLHQD